MDYFIIYWISGIILIPGLIAGIIAQARVSYNYHKYREMQSSAGVPAEQVARKILDNNGLQNISLSQIGGEMTDHYDPRAQNIALSQGVHGSSSIASISIAAHEVGHAIQTKEGYHATRLRTALVPVLNISSQLLWPLEIIGIIFCAFAGWDSAVGNMFMWLGIAFFGLSLLFSLVTLPTELDASRRGLIALREGGYIQTDEEILGAKRVLRAAAMTYVVAIFVSILNLARFVITMLILRNND